MEDKLHFFFKWKTTVDYFENGRQPTFFENGRRPQFYFKMEDDFIILKMEDDLNTFNGR
jgi:hypothetical protein